LKAVAIPAVPAVTATAFKKVRRGIRVFGGIPYLPNVLHP
jgi:hypothetical protein